GRPRRLDKHNIRRLIGRLRSRWEERKLCWRWLGQEVGLSVSGQTILRALSRYGYSRCKACKKPFINRQNQHEWMRYGCKHCQKPVDFWRKLMYSDKCFFNTSK
ncbi:hypothetical protein C7212DRAFT_203295, partial [Tuber magnatum]